MRVIVNLLLFQCGWWACILGAAHGRAWAGVAVVCVILCAHLMLISTARSLDALLIAGALAVGLIADTLLAASGAVDFGAQAWRGVFAPLFMLALWANFAVTLTTCLRWLKGRYGAAALLGAAGGPLAYYAGARFGAIALWPGNTALALALIGAAWCVAMLLVLAWWQWCARWTAS